MRRDRDGLLESPTPGEYVYTRKGEILRCPWHGWEFDIRTGQSYCDPARIRTKTYTVESTPGAAVVEGPYVAETVPVRVERITSWWTSSLQPVEGDCLGSPGLGSPVAPQTR
ncbi:MAG: Rieske 2Fe-2S domain-containing protein [Acetobacteraceae bacterium]